MWFREQDLKFRLTDMLSWFSITSQHVPHDDESEFMKKAKSESNDWGRPEYKRSDLGELARGKYTKRLGESSNVVILDPEVARAFPNSEAVNKALRALIHGTRQPKRTALKLKRKTTSTTKKQRIG